MTLGGKRIGGIARLLGHQQKKVAEAVAGDVVAFGRMDDVAYRRRADAVGQSAAELRPWPAPLPPVFALAIEAENRADEVKLTGALQQAARGGPVAATASTTDTHELLLRGQGDIHLQIAVERLQDQVQRRGQAPTSRACLQGDHPARGLAAGALQAPDRRPRQFGDVHIEIKPLPRGAGFEFVNKVVGGAIPKQFIPAVEAGVKELPRPGPLGFPVVDVAVTVTDGQYHTRRQLRNGVQAAARDGDDAKACRNASPVLLEPIFKVRDRRAERLHHERARADQRPARPDPRLRRPRPAGRAGTRCRRTCRRSEIQDLIIELRSLTQGVGTYRYEFDHLQELTGRLADQVIQGHRTDVAQAS